jgi:hypothetical protein
VWELWRRGVPQTLVHGACVTGVRRRKAKHAWVVRVQCGGSTIRIVAAADTVVMPRGEGLVLRKLKDIAPGTLISATSRRWAQVIRCRMQAVDYVYGLEVEPRGAGVCVEGTVWVW